LKKADAIVECQPCLTSNRTFAKSPVVCSFGFSVFSKTRFSCCILPTENWKLEVCKTSVQTHYNFLGCHRPIIDHHIVNQARPETAGLPLRVRSDLQVAKNESATHGARGDLDIINVQDSVDTVPYPDIDLEQLSQEWRQKPRSWTKNKECLRAIQLLNLAKVRAFSIGDG
jgi:hypothetical protein